MKPAAQPGTTVAAAAIVRVLVAAGLGLVLASEGASGYPLEGYETTGIRRLLGIRLAQEGLVRDARQPPGARLGLADVEFAFVGGELELLQIRPFLESRRARATSYLTRMDEGLRASFGRKVPLAEVPPP